MGTAIQSAGITHISPLTFLAARFFIGGCVTLIPAVISFKRLKSAYTGGLTKAALACGGVLFAGCSLQLFGLVTTSVGKVSFLTSLYVVIVPVAGLLFGRRPSRFVWLGIAVAVFGMYFMFVSGGVNIVTGDILAFLCAIAFAAQIMVIAHFSPKHNAVCLACAQFFVVAAIAAVAAIIFENPSLTGFQDGLLYILYAGVMSSGVAYLLQMFAQRTADPAKAALMFSTEAVAATVTGWLWLNQILSPMEILGCALVLTAVLISQTRSIKCQIK